MRDETNDNSQFTINNSQFTKGYKQTEIGIIPEDWEVDRIANQASITTGAKNTQDKIDEGIYPFFVRSQTVERINSYSFDGEAVLTAGDGVGTGKIYHYINGKFDFHQRVYKVSNFSKDLSGYFFFLYFSNNFYNRIMQMTAKSSVDSVRREMIADMKIPLPPIAEQEAIAEVLSDADALITSLDRLIAKKRNLKQGTMHLLLTGKKRLPNFNGDWETKKLGEIAEIDVDTLKGDTNPNYTFQYISLEDVDVGILRNSTECIFRFAPSRARRKIQKNDVLISTVRPNLKSHLYIKKDLRNFICSTGFSVIRCDEKTSHAKYIYNHFFGDVIDKQINLLLVGSNYPAINSKDIKNLQIPIPPIEEQKAIAEVLSGMDAEIAALEAKRDKYKALKQGMMQELLTGKTRLI